MSVRSELRQAAYQARGSHKTVANRTVVVNRFANYLRDQNSQIRHISQIKGKHLEHYIRAGVEKGLSPRSLQTEASALCTTLHAAGRGKLADNLNNKTLGISGASRVGTKTAMPTERYAVIRQAVVAKDPGVAACIELQRSLGLRQKAAIMASQSLKSWTSALSDGKSIRVIFGTKGGRPRNISPADRDRALAAVKAAMALAKSQNGRIVDKDNLKNAMALWTPCAAAASMSPPRHSITATARPLPIRLPGYWPNFAN